MSLERITAPAPSIALVLDGDEPRIVTRHGEVVALVDAGTAEVAEFLHDLRAMKALLDDAIAATAGDLALRSDAAGSRTLRVGGVTVTVGPDVERRFALEPAVLELRALLDTRGATFDEIAEAVEAIVRTKVVREPDMAAIKRLRARGDRDVNAILDRHTHTVAATRRAVKVEGA